MTGTSGADPEGGNAEGKAGGSEPGGRIGIGTRRVPSRAEMEGHLAAWFRATFDPDVIDGVILASSWASDEVVTSSRTGLPLSDLDLHVVARKPLRGVEGRLREHLRETLGFGPEIDCNVIPSERLKRLKRSLEAATTREVGRVILGDPEVLERFPHWTTVPHGEYRQLICNRAVELIACYAVSDPPPSDARQHRSVKALTDVARVCLHLRGSFASSYGERLEALRRMEDVNDGGLRAELRKLAMGGLELRLGGEQTDGRPSEEELYERARTALLLARRGLEEEFRAGGVRGAARRVAASLKGWARLVLRSGLRLRSLLPRSVGALLVDPVAANYEIFWLALRQAKRPSAYERESIPPDALARTFPLRTRRGAWEGSLERQLRLPLWFHRAALRGGRSAEADGEVARG